jgi:hypothetical protein
MAVTPSSLIELTQYVQLIGFIALIELIVKRIGPIERID